MAPRAPHGRPRRTRLTSWIELLNRKRWKTRVELANAIFEFIRQRRHSALGYRTPLEYELLSAQDTIHAAS